MGRKKSAKAVELSLPEGWEILRTSGEWAIVKVRIDDLEKVRLLKLPEGVREYFRETQRKYRQRLKERRKKK